MTIEEGLCLTSKRWPVEIPDVGRDALPAFLAGRGLRVGVEVGTEYGFYAEKLLQAGLHVTCVDPWTLVPGYRPGRLTQEQLDTWHACAVERLAKYGDRCRILRMTSMEALALVPDRSLDWVFLDGAHSFLHIAQDLCGWSQKVRHSGVISGHDFITIERRFDEVHVREVVEAYAKAYHIPFFVLGRKETVVGEIRDKQRSYLWINP